MQYVRRQAFDTSSLGIFDNLRHPAGQIYARRYLHAHYERVCVYVCVCMCLNACVHAVHTSAQWRRNIEEVTRSVMCDCMCTCDAFFGKCKCVGVASGFIRLHTCIRVGTRGMPAYPIARKTSEYGWWRVSVGYIPIQCPSQSRT